MFRVDLRTKRVKRERLRGYEFGRNRRRNLSNQQLAIIQLGGSLIHGEFHLRVWWVDGTSRSFRNLEHVRMIEFHHNGWEAKPRNSTNGWYRKGVSTLSF